MTNTESSVDWAIGRGANGVEVDLTFSKFGTLQFVRHSAPGEPCDCSCLCPTPVWFLCPFVAQNSVCAKLYTENRSMSPCTAQSSIVGMFGYLAEKDSLALIVIDSKVDAGDMSIWSMWNAGKAVVVKALDKYLFSCRFKGKVIIGSPKLDTYEYIKAAVTQANESAYKSRMYFTFDLEKNNIGATLRTLLNLPTKNIVYRTGISECAPKSSIKNSTLELALRNKVKGVVGLSYIWTLDKKSSMESHLPYVQGMVTNNPGRLHDVLMEKGIKLATPSSKIPQPTNSIITTSFKCDCDYRLTGGCIVSIAAPADLACKCLYQRLLSTCSGQVVQCRENGNKYCKTPDQSVHACLQGGGDCEGYKTQTCDCDYRPGGCRISKAPPANTACKCNYVGVWTCSGDVTHCSDTNSIYCKTPDTSVNTCVLGGGDCEGYENAKCDCDYHPGGCSISQPSPANTACKCKYKTLLWTCSGDVVKCVDFKSNYCKNPDKSVHSCFQGNGDCEGYKSASCDCDYHPGGCTISRIPPPNTACKCKHKGFWTCGGDIRRWRDPSSAYCKKPDYSWNTCFLGGGDCGGY